MKIRFSLILASLTALATLTTSAKTLHQEQISISGVVKDEAGEVIVGATVFVSENSAIGDVTDERGACDGRVGR